MSVYAIPNGKEIVAPRHVQRGHPSALVDFFEWSGTRGFESTEDLHTAVRVIQEFEKTPLKLGSKTLDPLTALTKQIGSAKLSKQIMEEGFFPFVDAMHPRVRKGYVRTLAHAFHLRAGSDNDQKLLAEKMLKVIEEDDDLTPAQIRSDLFAPIFDFRHQSTAPVFGQLHVLKVHLATLLHESDCIDHVRAFQTVNSLGTMLLAQGDAQKQQRINQIILSGMAIMGNNHEMWEVCSSLSECRCFKTGVFRPSWGVKLMSSPESAMVN